MSHRSRIVAFVEQHPGSGAGKIRAALGRDCTPDLTDLVKQKHLRRHPGVNGHFVYFPFVDTVAGKVSAALESAKPIVENLNRALAGNQAIADATRAKEIADAVVRERIGSVIGDVEALHQLMGSVVDRLRGLL